MHKYELTVVVNGKAEEEVKTATIEKVKGQIERFGGTVTNVTFESEDSNCPNEVESRVRIMDNVIRYLCVRQDA